MNVYDLSVYDQNHISLDIETLASDPDASVVSIGACAFRLVEGDQMPITIGSGQWYVKDPDGTINLDTIRWHLAQPDPALAIGTNSDPWYDTAHAAGELAQWLQGYGAEHEGRALVWTHATFDIPVLAMMYKRAGRRAPWHYRNCRDLRTLYQLAGGRPALPDVGTAHHALDDAIYQAREVGACFAAMTKGAT